MKTLKTMQAEVGEFCIEKGWRGEGVVGPTFVEAMALLHSEVSEAVEAYRLWGLDDTTDHYGSQPAALPKPEGVGSELADVLIRLLDDVDAFGIDLDFEYERKMAYNRTRSHRHGGKRL